MNEKSSSQLWTRVFIAVTAILFVVLGAFGAGLVLGYGGQTALAAGGFPVGKPATNTPPPASKDPVATGAPDAAADLVLDQELFDEAMDLLKKQYYGDLPQGPDVTYDAIRGIVDRLGDEHTAFVDPQGAALINADIEGHFEGIGARVQRPPEGGGIQIEYLFPDQPAEKAGMRVGDLIVKVDGQDATDMSVMEAISLIRGPRDSEVLLTIVRDGGEPFDLKVKRARIEIPVVESNTLADGKIAYVKLAEFSSVASDRVGAAVEKALRNNPKGLILDLRGDPGGLLDAAVSIGSMFVPEGNIVLERKKDGSQRDYARKGRYLLGDTPLVVLVDGGSASASEIVAGAVQDAKTGVLIGEKTYGKGSVQVPNSLSDGSQLRVTIAHWFTPKGRGIHKVGLQPDIEVKLTQEDREAKRDPQLDRAVKYLLEGR